MEIPYFIPLLLNVINELVLALEIEFANVIEFFT